MLGMSKHMGCPNIQGAFLHAFLSHKAGFSTSIYKKVEMDKPVNIETMVQEIEDDKMKRNRLKEEEDENEINPYQMAVLNKKFREDVKIEQMINWSIFSDLIKYVDGSSCSDVIPSLTVRPLDDRKHKRLYNSLKIDEDLTADNI